MSARIQIAMELKTDLDYELGLSCGEVWSKALGGPICPLVMYPHVEVHSGEFTAEIISWFTQSAITQYSPADIEALQADPAKQARFCEVERPCGICAAPLRTEERLTTLYAYAHAAQVHTDCIVPYYRAVADIYVHVKHLFEVDGVFEFPLAKMVGGTGFDVNTFLGGKVFELFQHFGAFAQAWTPLKCRWYVVRYENNETEHQ
jgi:hypothetical protein